MSYSPSAEYLAFVLRSARLSYNGLAKIDSFVFENIGSKHIYLRTKHRWTIELALAD